MYIYIYVYIYIRTYIVRSTYSKVPNNRSHGYVLLGTRLHLDRHGTQNQQKTIAFNIICVLEAQGVAAKSGKNKQNTCIEQQN